MPSATITSKGQITIPAEVRESLGVGFGDRLWNWKKGDLSFCQPPVRYKN